MRSSYCSSCLIVLHVPWQASCTDSRSFGPFWNTLNQRAWRSSPSCRSIWASSSVWRTSGWMWVHFWFHLAWNQHDFFQNVCLHCCLGWQNTQKETLHYTIDKNTPCQAAGFWLVFLVCRAGRCGKKLKSWFILFFFWECLTDSQLKKKKNQDFNFLPHRPALHTRNTNQNPAASLLENITTTWFK